MNKLEFNHDGSLKVPDNLKKKKIDLNNTIILEYEKEFWGDVIDCKFSIILPKNLNEDNLNKIESWVDKKVETNPLSTDIKIEKSAPRKFSLLISGKGKDNRCTWCRSFRTSLKTLCNKENLDLIQKTFCKFEKSLVK